VTTGAQRAQTSAERQNPVNPDFGLRTPGSGRWSGSSAKCNHLVPWPESKRASVLFVLTTWQFFPRIRIVIRNGLPDPESDADRHQNVISWSLGYTPALHKISSKSVGNFFGNPVNADFGLRTPGSGQWSGSSPKLNPSFLWSCPTPPRNFVKIRSQLFQLSNGQTDRQTDRSENITSFGGGNYT